MNINYIASSAYGKDLEWWKTEILELIDSKKRTLPIIFEFKTHHGVQKAGN